MTRAVERAEHQAKGANSRTCLINDTVFGYTVSGEIARKCLRNGQGSAAGCKEFGIADCPCRAPAALRRYYGIDAVGTSDRCRDTEECYHHQYMNEFHSQPPLAFLRTEQSDTGLQFCYHSTQRSLTQSACIRWLYSSTDPSRPMGVQSFSQSGGQPA